MTAPTSQMLADSLRGAGFEDLAKRAERDEFHDFLSDDAMPSITLDNELVKIIKGAKDERQRQAATNIRMRHHEGAFDASKEESDAWAESDEGIDAFTRLIKGE